MANVNLNFNAFLEKNKLKDGGYAYTAKEASEQTALDDEVAKINRALIEQRYYMGWLEETSANIASLSFTINHPILNLSSQHY